jgi:hypothetical protein
MRSIHVSAKDFLTGSLLLAGSDGMGMVLLTDVGAMPHDTTWAARPVRKAMSRPEAEAETARDGEELRHHGCVRSQQCSKLPQHVGACNRCSQPGSTAS